LTLRSYIIKRVVISIIILFVAATLNFFIFVVYPADPVRYLLDPTMKPEQKRLIEIEYGKYDPLWLKYGKYLRNMFSFGLIPPYFGISFETRDFVARDMYWRLALTVALLGGALIGDLVIGIPIGMFAASKRGTKLDVSVMGLGLFTWGLPTFFIQLLAILFFSGFLKQWTGVSIFPSGGWASYPPPQSQILFVADIAWHLALPMLTLIAAGFAGTALYVRNLMIDALTQDYILTARAKGVKERVVLMKHAFKSILPPIATMITLSIPGLVTGAIITETIFGLQGIGAWYLASLSRGAPDFPVVQAVLFVFASLVVICNFIADILYGVLDPRIKVGMRR
jgi:peptide/nickel transport system permease protein